MEDKWETETGRFFKFSTSKDSKEGGKNDSKDETEVALEEGGMSVGRKEGKVLIGAREVRVLKCSGGKEERCMCPMRKEDSRRIL